MTLTGPLVRNSEPFNGDVRISMAHSWLYRNTGRLAIIGCVSFWVVVGSLIYVAF